MPSPAFSWRDDHRLAPGAPSAHPHPLNGENCTVLLSDVVGFGARTRTDEDRRVIREALFRITHVVLQELPDVWSWDDRGDGLLTVVPPSVPTARIIGHLHKELPAALEEHNRAHPDSARIQLRVAVNVGPVVTDTMGVSGEAIIITARLVEAPLLKEAMDKARPALASSRLRSSTRPLSGTTRPERILPGPGRCQRIQSPGLDEAFRRGAIAIECQIAKFCSGAGSYQQAASPPRAVAPSGPGFP